MAKISGYSPITAVRLSLAATFCMVLLALFARSGAAEPPPPTSGTAPPAAVTQGQITLTVTGFSSDLGQARILVHGGPGSFPGKQDRALRRYVAPIRNRTVTLQLEALPYGSYALTAHHDENSNNKVDSNFIGIPSEGLGCSNDPRPRFGPPGFEDARFVLDRPALPMRIALAY
jgi:uncharacterized protein (DUF2141 family)